MIRSSWAVTVGGVVGSGLVALYIVGLMWAMEHDSYNLWGSMIMVPLLLWVNIFGVLRVAKTEPGEWFGRLMLGALALKMVASMVRYWVAFVLYDGAADAATYNLYAAFQYKIWRQGQFIWDLGHSTVTGTDFMRIATTAIYTIIGPAPITGFIVFATMAFWGTYCLYRAFRLAYPAGDHRRYAMFLFFLPTILYWPSSIGKDAWMLLFIGLVALGTARMFANLGGGYVLLAIGLVGCAAVRPHFAALLIAGVVAAQLFRPARSFNVGIASKIVALAVLIGACVVIGNLTASFLGIDDFSAAGISAGIEDAGSRTTEGNSSFAAVAVSSLLDYPSALVTVLFRPFPWEAGNLQMMVTALEASFLLVLFLANLPRIRLALTQLTRFPYLLFSGLYVLLFVYVFSGFANFGILARERSLLLPFLLVFLAAPLPAHLIRKRAEAKAIERALAGVR